MNRKRLFELLKFYKGETINPFIGNDPLKAKWWEGEKALLERVDEEEDFFARVKEMLLEAIQKGHVNNALADEKRSLDERTIVFFLDLWHGKHYPYDSLDDIFDYIK